MTTLQLFLAPGEVDTLLEGLAESHGLGCCGFRNGRLERTTTAANLQRVFLAPVEQLERLAIEEAIRPRELGWIDVTLGALTGAGHRRILTLTTLQCEDRKGLPHKPSAWLRALEKDPEPIQLAYGVRGVNVVHGGASDYRDIGYSVGALRLHGQGVVWKQYSDDNSEFLPLLEPEAGAKS